MALRDVVILESIWPGLAEFRSKFRPLGRKTPCLFPAYTPVPQGAKRRPVRTNTLVCPSRRQTARMMFEPRSRGFCGPLLDRPFYGWHRSPQVLLFGARPLTAAERDLGWGDSQPLPNGRGSGRRKPSVAEPRA